MPHNLTPATVKTLSAPAAQASEATRLRVLAGTPHSRRGSVLVLVVGVLALLAIIIVVYTSVGQADVRGGRALVNKARLDDQSRAISEHIRGIVGADATAVRVQRVYTGPGAGTYYSTRETSDYPYTDPAARSNITLGGITNPDLVRFEPAGNITTAWVSPNEDPRVTSDAYLGSTEPTWVNRDLTSLPAMPDPFPLMGLHRDWGHFTIVTPSGLPVNLANLRGNFSAPSGFTATGPYSNATTPAMSDWLYLWGRASGSGADRYSATPTANQVTQIDAYNSPAVWSNDRLETFRPTTYNPDGLAAGDAKLMSNTLADADGDGMFDSVWQELVDASDPTRPSSLLPGGTGLRIFIAPRIVDLSSMVNVNTATSFAVPPDIENPAGFTPSDIDLERLLTLADSRQYFAIHPDTAWVDGANYNNALQVTKAGFSAFAGILEGRVTGMAEVGYNQHLDYSGPDLAMPEWLRGIGVQRPTGVNGSTQGTLLGSVTRTVLYTVGGKDEVGGQLRTDTSNSNPYLKQSGGYGMSDELELRKFGSVNDGKTTSRLETSATVSSAYALISPFRSLRDTVTDRDAGGMAAGTVSFQGETVPRSVAQFFTDPRHLLTTLSGSRPIRASHRALTGPNDPNIQYAMTDDEVRTDVVPLIRNAVARTADASAGIYPVSAANEIFANYALALSPYLGDPLVWNDATSGIKRSHGMSFGGPTYETATTGTQVGETVNSTFRGRAAELAVRTGAHMTMNLLAWQDDTKTGVAAVHPDGRPLAATLLLDETHRGDVVSAVYSGGGAVRAFPYWASTLTGRLPTNSTISPEGALGSTKVDAKAYALDLNMGVPAAESRLAGSNGTNTMSTGWAINVFAAQPQPFITATTVFDMYYDAPLANGGDSRAAGASDRDGEWVPIDDGMGNVVGIDPLGVTINGTVSAANNDFLLECVAFQVTNPFDAPITLGDPSGNFAYYFEFAGKYYDVARYDAAGVRTGPVTLLPRQSVNFYVTSQAPADTLARWRAADGTIDSLATGGNNVLDSWIKKQLTAASANSAMAIRTVQINPTDGSRIGGTFNDIMASSATSDANKVVRLWRVVRDSASGEGGNNNIANDYLVDRLHDPKYGSGDRATLYRRLDSGNNRFTNIAAGPEPSEPEYINAATQADNVGIAITLFGAIRRPTDPNGGPLPNASADTQAGVIPAWCVEPKHAYGFAAAANAKNVTEANPNFENSGSISGVTINEFTGANNDAAARSFKRMIQNGIQAADGYTTAAKHPANRNESTDATNVIKSDLAGVSWKGGHKASQFPIYPRRNNPTIFDTEVKRPPLRPADLLLPWAVGPYQNPTLTGANAEATMELRHTTLSEALAFGLNYSRSNDDTTYEFQIGKTLDRGRLPTDRFVPFNDINSDGAWTYNNGSPDPSISNGVPFALNILDRFRTTRYGTIDSATQGQINVNTAPYSVLRTLPLVTPVSANVYGTDNNGFRDSWMNSSTGPFALKLRDEGGGTPAARSLWKASDDRWDIAATFAAYRDRQAVVVRGEQNDEAGNSRAYVDFSPLNDGKAPTAPDYRGGRAFMTNCVNVRSEPGFKSIGEMMMAIVQDNTTRTAQNFDDEHLKQFGIDRFAQMGSNANQSGESPSNFVTEITRISDTAALGVTEGTGNARQQAFGLTAQSFLRRLSSPVGATQFVHGGATADYDRKIAIADALMNVVSTRSDYFCAYFLVNGYTEADTQGLEPWTGNGAAPNEDRYTRPMVPSVQRRYMMVLDRSQCTRPGDKPKVLMFEELPVK